MKLGYTIIYVSDVPATVANWEVCFVTDDVTTAFDHAVDAGCIALVPPDEKPWGQTVSYVRDLNGCIVEIASPIGA